MPNTGSLGAKKGALRGASVGREEERGEQRRIRKVIFWTVGSISENHRFKSTFRL